MRWMLCLEPAVTTALALRSPVVNAIFFSNFSAFFSLPHQHLGHAQLPTVAGKQKIGHISPSCFPRRPFPSVVPGHYNFNEMDKAFDAPPIHRPPNSAFH